MEILVPFIFNYIVSRWILQTLACSPLIGILYKCDKVLTTLDEVKMYEV